MSLTLATMQAGVIRLTQNALNRVRIGLDFRETLWRAVRRERESATLGLDLSRPGSEPSIPSSRSSASGEPGDADLSISTERDARGDVVCYALSPSDCESLASVPYEHVDADAAAVADAAASATASAESSAAACDRRDDTEYLLDPWTFPSDENTAAADQPPKRARSSSPEGLPSLLAEYPLGDDFADEFNAKHPGLRAIPGVAPETLAALHLEPTTEPGVHFAHDATLTMDDLTKLGDPADGFPVEFDWTAVPASLKGQLFHETARQFKLCPRDVVIPLGISPATYERAVSTLMGVSVASTDGKPGSSAMSATDAHAIFNTLYRAARQHGPHSSRPPMPCNSHHASQGSSPSSVPVQASSPPHRAPSSAPSSKSPTSYDSLHPSTLTHSPPTTSSERTGRPKSEARRRNARQRRGRMRAEERETEMQEAERSGSFVHLNKKIKDRHLDTPDIAVGYSASEYSVEGPGDRGKEKATRESKLRTSEDLEKANIKPVVWDGKQSYTIIDSESRIVAALLGWPSDRQGTPDDKTWAAVIERLAHKLERWGQEFDELFNKIALSKARRGPFKAFSFGVSYGQGQPQPQRLSLSTKKTSSGKTFSDLEREVRADVDVQRVSAHQSMGLAYFFPKVFDDLVLLLDALSENNPGIKPADMNFRTSAYPTCTLNMSDNTATLGHYDTTNKPGLPCAVTALGWFTGGDLWLQELGLRIQVPAGATVLLSSACVKHGNTAIGPNDKRFSITQYAVGGLWQWARYGFKTLPENKKQAAKITSKANGEPGSQFQYQLDLLSKQEELVGDRKWLHKREQARREVRKARRT